ncbi:MAG: 4Fe-4S dicluster domain-containing protein [Chloroflexota bacterium]|nr:4Fe-4S dicluster domain-containing protein [Chloroflexota bacterium]
MVELHKELELHNLKKAPRIVFDTAKCPTPFACRKCLDVCPSMVFAVRPTRYVRLKEQDPKEPGAYRLEALHRFSCTGCNDCIKVCPVNAITITFPEEVARG